MNNDNQEMALIANRKLYWHIIVSCLKALGKAWIKKVNSKKKENTHQIMDEFLSVRDKTFMCQIYWDTCKASYESCLLKLTSYEN